MFDIVVSGGTAVLPSGPEPADLGVNGEHIAAIGAPGSFAAIGASAPYATRRPSGWTAWPAPVRSVAGSVFHNCAAAATRRARDSSPKRVWSSGSTRLTARIAQRLRHARDLDR